MSEFQAYVEAELTRKHEEIRRVCRMLDELRAMYDQQERALLEAQAMALNAEERVSTDGGQTTKGGYLTPERLGMVMANCKSELGKLSVIERIKTVRAISGLGLKPAKDLVESIWETKL